MVKKWLIYLVLFLLAANVAVMLSLYLRTSKNEDEKIVMKHDRPHPRESNFEQHLAHELDFDESQRLELKKMSDTFHQERREAKRHLDQVRGQYYNLLTEETTDVSKLDELVKEIGTAESDIIRLEYRHYHDIRGLCSPGQVARFDSMGKCRMQKHLKRYGLDTHRRQPGCVPPNKDIN